MNADELTAWFTTNCGDDGVFPFTEDDHANIHGYGHQDKAAFAAEVNRYDAVCNGEPFSESECWDESHIEHRWAVMDPDGEKFWVTVPANDERMNHLLVPGPVTAETPGAFPITTLWGQR